MTSDEIKKIFKEVFEEERDEFWVPQPQHYLDHEMLKDCREAREEWRKNHEFISAIRSGASWGQKMGITLIVTSTLSFLGWAIWQGIKMLIRE